MHKMKVTHQLPHASNVNSSASVLQDTLGPGLRRFRVQVLRSLGAEL